MPQLLPPWLACVRTQPPGLNSMLNKSSQGWYSVRRERKVGIHIFLFMCLCYLGGWGAMFDSTTFRWTYVTWTFFGVMTTSSVFLTLLSFILSIICRFNFGKGLPHYCAWLILAARALPLTLRAIVNAQQPFEDDFKPHIVGDPEKVAFPLNNEPTFSVAFGPEAQVLPAPQMFARNAVLRRAQSMRMVNQNSLQQPPAALIRAPSESTYPQHHRQRSQSSVDSSTSSSNQRTDNKRWVIE